MDGTKFLLMIVLSLFLGGCEDPNRPIAIPLVSPDPLPTDPMSTFCGANCSLCGYSQEKCLNVLQANLGDLCNNDKENCYLKWKQYAHTCKTICTNMQKVDHDIRTTNAMTFFMRKKG